MAVKGSDYEHCAPPDVSTWRAGIRDCACSTVSGLARLQTNWFERHGSTPITEIPQHWPEDYRRVVLRRIEIIEQSASIKLIEQPLCKRRWNLSTWEELEQDAVRDWLLAVWSPHNTGEPMPKHQRHSPPLAVWPTLHGWMLTSCR